MQVEHKTEKGTVLFILAPKEATGYKVIERPCSSIEFDIKYGLDKEYLDLPNGFKLIGLASEVTEEQAKMMVDIYPIFDQAFFDYLDKKQYKLKALYSFKSLMHHLQVCESIPKRGIIDESRVGKWVVLFKEN
jgi:hypothetical protein